MQLNAANGEAAEPYNVVALLQVQHKVTIVRTAVGASSSTVAARDVLLTAIDDDAHGVVSFAPNGYRPYELQVLEGDDTVRATQRYELRATRCRVNATSGAVGPLYAVRPFLVDAATNLPVSGDVGELRLYEVNAASGEMARVPPSSNGRLQIGGAGARSASNGCRAFVEVVFKRDFQQLGERLYFVKHEVSSLDPEVGPLIARSPSCPPIALPRDVAVVVRDSDTASVDVQPLFERVQVIEGRVSSTYSVRLSKRPVSPVSQLRPTTISARFTLYGVCLLLFVCLFVFLLLCR